jgi:hypothetical protein
MHVKRQAVEAAWIAIAAIGFIALAIACYAMTGELPVSSFAP